MEKALAPFAPYAYAIMRLIVGLLFVSHAGQKLFGWFGGRPFPLGSLLGLAGMIEIVLGLLITIGLAARRRGL
jgi:putative oxidoreductase